MEKLKAKHDHKLTDILKVFIFGLFLIMPFIVFAPSLLYISFNPNAEAEQTTINVDEYKQVNFNQLVQNGNFESFDNWNLFDVNATNYVINSNELEINIVNDTFSYWQYGFYQTIPTLTLGNKYVVRITLDSSTFTSYRVEILSGNATNLVNGFNSVLIEPTVEYGKQLGFYPLGNYNINTSYTVKNIQVFNLTQMFGSGNEPTIQQFNEWFPNNYYEYTASKITVIKIGTTTETIQDVQTQIANNWQQMWNKQIFKWTNETILYKGISAFSQTFGIFDNSYITNLITYELIIVMIYIVIDIILTMFKWLTHIIGEK